MPKKKTVNNYFDDKVESAVCTYLNADTQKEREAAFSLIYPALCKIAEVWYHKTKFTYSDDDIQDVMADCVAWLVEKMPMFKCGRGTKAFSYYTVTARFFYIQLANKNYKYFQKFIPLSQMTENWDVENEDRIKERQKNNADLYYAFLDYLAINYDKVFTKPFQKFGYPLLDMLSNFETIEEINRRKILNELHGKISDKPKDRVYITKLMTKLSAQFTLFKIRWESGNNSLDYIQKNTLTLEEKQYIKENVKIGKQNGGVRSIARKLGVDTELVQQYTKSIL